MIDGLGHGDEAADASAAAAEVIRAHAADPAAVLVERCHEALRKTRGAVMTLAWFDLVEEEIWWLGVGNVEARLVRGAAVFGDRHDSALVLGGVVGYKLPAVRPTRMDLMPGDAVAFATDGIEADYSSSLTPEPARAAARRAHPRAPPQGHRRRAGRGRAVHPGPLACNARGNQESAYAPLCSSERLLGHPLGDVTA